MRVTYSGPVKTGTRQDTAEGGQNARSNSNHILMCQTDSFTGSEAWTVVTPGDGDLDSELIFKPLDIVIPAGSQICRIDMIISDHFDGSNKEKLYLGIMTSETTARTDWFGYDAVSGNASGVRDPSWQADPDNWYDVGHSGAGTNWPNAGEDVRICATFLNETTDTKNGWWNHVTNARLIYTLNVDGGDGPPPVGAPIAGTDTSLAGDSGIPVGSKVVSVDTVANTITIDKDLTTTVLEGAANSMRWSESTQGQARINVYYLQDRNATPSS